MKKILLYLINNLFLVIFNKFLKVDLKVLLSFYEYKFSKILFLKSIKIPFINIDTHPWGNVGDLKSNKKNESRKVIA